MRPIRLFALGLIAFIAFRTVVHNTFRKLVTGAATASERRSACIVMAGNTTRDEEGATYIVGQIRNDCDQTINDVTISFQLDPGPESRFNTSGAYAIAYSRDVRPGETRPFKTVVPIGRKTTYHFSKIRAY